MSNTKQPTHVKIKQCSDDSYWYKNEIGKTFKINYMVDGMYRVWKTNSQSFFVKTEDVEFIYEPDNTKQPPVELIDKYKYHLLSKSGCESIELEAEQCAQIAIDYSEKSSKGLKQFIGMIINMDEEHGREGCTYGDTDFDSLSACHGHNELLNYLKARAKQLLNKK